MRSCKAYPDKFRGCLCVDESQLGQESEIEHLLRCVRELGLTALYMDNDRFWSGAQGADFGAAPYVPFWETVQELGIPVLWDIRFVQRRAQADYLGEVARLHRFARQFPKIRQRLHPRHPAPGIHADGRIPDEILALLREPNVTLELLFPLLYGASLGVPVHRGPADHP